MGKATPDAVLDAMPNVIKAANAMVACSAEPTTYAQANASLALADVTMAPGDFANANGDVSGRKLTIAAKSGVLIDATGTATHIALINRTTSELLYVTTCTSQALTANGSNTVSFPAWKIEIADPV